ncbi:MAG: RHS repeat-associated core domain-containing protein [Patescibacteria group bacterium]
MKSVKILRRVRVTVKPHTFSLDPMWSAFLQYKGRVVESPQRNATNLLSPYWPPNRESAFLFPEYGEGVDAVPTTTYGYDQSGNLTSANSNLYGWDFKNRMASTTVGGIVTTFGYDHGIERVFKSTNFATTTYPSKYYSATSATTTKYVFAGDELIATITTSGATSTKQYIHNDHLGGTNVVTDEDSNTVQALDYYPYGSERIDQNYGGSPSQKTYIGLYSDSETDLLYAKARYLEPSRGQFISQDPVFWEIGLTQDGRNALINPQAANSYSYAEDNPITKKDPDGRCAGPFIAAAPVCLGVAYGIIETAATNPDATFGQYVVGAVSGGIQGGLLEARIVGGAILGFGSSLAQDYVGGQSLNFQRAFVAAGSNAVGAGTIKSAVSGVTNVAAQAGGTLSLNAGSRAVASGISGGYQTVTNVSAQRSFAPVISQPSNSNASKSTSPSSSGGGFVGQVVNSIKSFVSSIFK